MSNMARAITWLLLPSEYVNAELQVSLSYCFKAQRRPLTVNYLLIIFLCRLFWNQHLEWLCYYNITLCIWAVHIDNGLLPDLLICSVYKTISDSQENVLKSGLEILNIQTFICELTVLSCGSFSCGFLCESKTQSLLPAPSFSDTIQFQQKNIFNIMGKYHPW